MHLALLPSSNEVEAGSAYKCASQPVGGGGAVPQRRGEADRFAGRMEQIVWSANVVGKGLTAGRDRGRVFFINLAAVWPGEDLPWLRHRELVRLYSQQDPIRRLPLLVCLASNGESLWVLPRRCV
jgi:hypothetical protein